MKTSVRLNISLFLNSGEGSTTGGIQDQPCSSDTDCPPFAKCVGSLCKCVEGAYESFPGQCDTSKSFLFIQLTLDKDFLAIFWAFDVAICPSSAASFTSCLDTYA